MLRTTDNNCGKTLKELDEHLSEKELDEHWENLLSIGNCKIEDLCKNSPDLFIFPKSSEKYHDDIEKSPIFSLQEKDKKLITSNIMGFVGKNETQLTISSRFAKDENDYFLHYMLQKVFSINIFKFEQTPNKENIWDFLLYLFPYYLKKAYKQSLYKAYKREEYNDANIKGTTDVKRHIRTNIPFCGKVAYSMREHNYDNTLNQLIRHTIEHIRTHPWGSNLLTSDSEMRDIVSKFCFITQQTYNKNARQKIISANLKPVSHPYFTEYKELQKICLRILRHEKITFGAKNDKIYGLLFDGAWLWEEYLNKVLQDNFIHPENKTKKDKEYLFENFQPIYPDFISKEQPIKVGDAKYIPLENKKNIGDDEKATSIYYKTITYMYRFNSTEGFLLFPHPEISFDEKYKIKDTDGSLRKLGLAIPKNAESFIDFQNAMRENEESIKNELIKNSQSY
ncbi:MAG: McrC family protein [Bacteroidales bacterium]|jgi:5-methylcytosine-specific restriction endonuclease McrBC regulatory subunit McrC|nr:McrC family protein [Bacteroidales bacterium]